MAAGKSIAVLWLILFTGCAGNDAERREKPEGSIQAAEKPFKEVDSLWKMDPIEVSAIYARNIAHSDSFIQEYNRGKDEFGAYGYIEPHDFPGLPQAIADWLAQGGYRIPQIVPLIMYDFAPELKFHNAIHGEYLKAGQEDWAVYATNKDTTAVFIFYDGSTDNIELIEADCCNLSIDTATEENITFQYETLKEDGAPKPPKLDHSGICIGYFEKSSSIHYKYKGEWIVLAGAD